MIYWLIYLSIIFIGLIISLILLFKSSVKMNRPHVCNDDGPGVYLCEGYGEILITEAPSDKGKREIWIKSNNINGQSTNCSICGRSSFNRSLREGY